MRHLTEEEVREIAREVVKECHSAVDEEIQALRDKTWSEEKAIKLAELAATAALSRMAKDFYASVGKKTMTVIGIAVVTLSMASDKARDTIIGLFK